MVWKMVENLDSDKFEFNHFRFGHERHHSNFGSLRIIETDSAAPIPRQFGSRGETDGDRQAMKNEKPL